MNKLSIESIAAFNQAVSNLNSVIAACKNESDCFACVEGGSISIVDSKKTPGEAMGADSTVLAQANINACTGVW